MINIVKKYGKIIEVTTFEKAPPKICVRRRRKKRTIYGVRRPDNIWRTRKICMRRVHAALKEFGCPILVTLTFAGDASDASFANDSLRIFQMRLRTKYGKPYSLFVPELSPRGRIHFHGLIFNVPLSLGDTCVGRRIISYGEERSTRVLANLWGEGYVDARKTDGSGKLATYITGYITKGGEQVMFNAMRLLRISHGFPKEIVMRKKVAKRIAEKYAKRKPIYEWHGMNEFVGIINRKTYEEK